MLEQFLLSAEGWIENKIEACSVCASCYYGLGQEQCALNALLRSLSFDSPRAEVCCEIGKYFLEHGKYETAVYWYETALGRPRNKYSSGFVLPDCYDYIPFLQLCVCFDKMGDKKKAKEYNERAGLVSHIPKHISIISSILTVCRFPRACRRRVLIFLAF